MVSLVQMGRLGQLDKEGWVSVGGPFTVEETPIGGPTIMMNAAQDVIQVNADGTIVRLGPKFPRDIIEEAHMAIDAVTNAHQQMSLPQVKEALLGLRRHVDNYLSLFEEGDDLSEPAAK